MGKRLYVGNLSYSVTNESLEELFSQFGTVQSAQVVQDRDSGRSKGFGFVEMGDDNAAQEAIRGLHEKEHRRPQSDRQRSPAAQRAQRRRRTWWLRRRRWRTRRLRPALDRQQRVNSAIAGGVGAAGDRLSARQAINSCASREARCGTAHRFAP